MVKKKQQSSEAAGDVAAGVSVSGDMKALIHDHSLFFDRLVELIPAKFYLPTDDQEKVWFQGLSKYQKEKAKRKTVENTKKARRDRLDPEKSSKTTLDLLKESVEKEKTGNKSDAAAEENGVSTEPEEGDGATYEELRQKLRRKIDELRSGRGGTDIDEERRAEKLEARKRKQELTKRSREAKKRNKEESKNKKAERKSEKDEELTMEVSAPAKGIESGKAKSGENDSKRNPKKRKSEVKISAAADGIEFGKVKLGDDDLKRNPKKRKMSKEEELERARKLEEAKKDPEKGKSVIEKHSWQAATSRAMGVKVHDNPRLLKESIQREKKKHKKSVEKWNDRVKNTENVKKERQDKRKGNIQSNIEKKKMKKIERREKKLMKRPGFEGRKDGYINGQSIGGR